MYGYKRNQGLEAISVVIGEGRMPSAALRTDVKRLLDTDRAMNVSPRSSDPAHANYAFFSDEAPGRGFEVLFSAYEIFALLVGLNLMAHGWPQATVVSILRRARPDLERKQTKILQWNPDELFDEKKIFEAAREGAIAVPSTRPVFLMILSSKRRAKDSPSEELMVAVFEQGEVNRIPPRPAGSSWTLMELTKVAHDLRAALATTKPSKRGRASS